MKTHTIVHLIFLVLFTISTQAFSQEYILEEEEHQEVDGLSKEDVTAINNVLDKFSKDYVANNLDGVMAAFADHAVYLEGRVIDDGKNAIHDNQFGIHFPIITYLQYKSRDRVIRGKGMDSFACVKWLLHC